MRSLLVYGMAIAAVLSSTRPYMLDIYALPRVPVKVFGTLMSVEPAISAVVGLAILGQQLTVRQTPGPWVIVLTSVGTTVTVAQGVEPLPQGTDRMAGDPGVTKADGVGAPAPNGSPPSTRSRGDVIELRGGPVRFQDMSR